MLFATSKPARTQNHRQAQKDGETGPGDAIECCFSTAGAAEHGAAAGCQSTHAITFGAVEEHQNNQQKTAANPGPGENGGEHQTG